MVASYPDYWNENLFVTEDEEVAKKFCEKALALRPKLVSMSNWITDKFDTLPRSEWTQHMFDLEEKYDALLEITDIKYETIKTK